MSRDDAYLFDILDAARLAQAYVRGKTQAEFLADTLCQDAVIRRLEKLYRLTVELVAVVKFRHCAGVVQW